jgi:hypothetical protein
MTFEELQRSFRLLIPVVDGVAIKRPFRNTQAGTDTLYGIHLSLIDLERHR